MNSPDIFFRVSPKKWKFRLENENFQISRKSCWKFFIISDKDLQDQPGMSLPVLGIMQTTLNMLDIWKSVIGGGRPMNLKAGSIKKFANGMHRLNSEKVQNFHFQD